MSEPDFFEWKIKPPDCKNTKLTLTSELTKTQTLPLVIHGSLGAHSGSLCSEMEPVQLPNWKQTQRSPAPGKQSSGGTKTAETEVSEGLQSRRRDQQQEK